VFESSNGILRRRWRPRMHKHERQQRSKKRMRFVGIDIGSERHMVATVDETGTVMQKPLSFGEEAAGYRRLRERAARRARGLFGGYGSDRSLLAQSMPDPPALTD